MSQVDQDILNKLSWGIQNYLAYNQAVLDAQNSFLATQRVGMEPLRDPYAGIVTVIETGPLQIPSPPTGATSYSDEMKIYYYA